MTSDHPFLELRTQRLVLRRFRPADAPAFLAYRADPDVARYQSWEPTYSLQNAESFMDEMASISPGTPGSWFQFAVISAETGELLGDVGLRTDAEEPGLVELGVTLSATHRDRGFATEMIGAVIDYAFSTLHAGTIRAVTDTRNAPSIRLLERLGFTLIGTEDAMFKGETCREHTYELIAPS